MYHDIIVQKGMIIGIQVKHTKGSDERQNNRSHIKALRFRRARVLQSSVTMY